MATSPLSLLTAEQRDALPRADVPRQAHAMSATLAREPFSDPDWIFERKLDGIRCVAIRDGGPRYSCCRATTCRSTPAFPRWRRARGSDALASCSTVRSWRSPAGRRASRGWPAGASALSACTSTCSTCSGSTDRDVRGLALRDRKRLLRADAAASPTTPCVSPPIATVTARPTSATPARTAGRGWWPSAPIAPTSPRRSRDWLKLKCEQGQELVIGGYTAPRGSRTRLRRAAARLLRGRGAALRGQGRHRL